MSPATENLPACKAYQWVLARITIASCGWQDHTKCMGTRAPAHTIALVAASSAAADPMRPCGTEQR